MKKNLFTFGLFLTLTLFLPYETQAQEENTTFSDTKNSLYEEAIYFLQGKKIIKGYEDQTFRPDNKVNRAEFLKILIQTNYAEDLTRGGYQETCFSDIENKLEWYVPYACLAKKYGIIKGYEGNLLKPEKNINFAEASKIINNIYSKDTREHNEIWYKNYIEYLLENKLVPPQLTQFDREITRGEVSEMISRAIKLKENKLENYLEFRKNKYGESTLPTWESLNKNTEKTTEVSNKKHPGIFINGNYISNYEQYTNTDYPANVNNNKLSKTDENEIRAELETLLNQERSNNQKTTFTKNNTLETVAQNFAEEMVINAFYSHMNLSGQKPNERLSEAGYQQSSAESIVWKSKGASDAINWWKNSTLHWNNILKDDFTQMGIGIVEEPTGGNIIVLLTGQ